MRLPLVTFPLEETVMIDPPSDTDRPARYSLADFQNEDPQVLAADARRRLRPWLLGGLAIVILAGVVLAIVLPPRVARQREENAAVKAAVRHFVQSYHDSAARVYKHCKIGRERLPDGSWRVSIASIVSQPPNGWAITSTYKVDPGGKVEFVDRIEDKYK